MLLVWTELRLTVREPLVAVFVFAFPAFTALVLGGVFDRDDPAFEGIEPAGWYLVGYPGVVAAAIGLISLPVQVAGYRERGIDRRFRVSRYPAWALPLAQVTVGALLTVAGTATLLAAGAASHGIPAAADWSASVVALALATVTFVALGVALGSVLPSARSAQALGLLLFLPMFLLGGGGPPPEAMTPAMNAIAQWLPLTHATRAIQQAWLDLRGQEGNHLWQLATCLAVAVAVTATGERIRRR